MIANFPFHNRYLQLFYISHVYNKLYQKSSVVNYDTKSGWSTILSQFNDIQKISNGTQIGINELEDLIKNASIPEDLNKWIGGFSDVDEEFIKLVGDVQNGNKSFEDIETYMQSASSATSKFGAALKSALANIGIALAINAVIKVLTELSQVEDEVREKAQKLSAEFSSSKSDIDGYKEQIEELYKTINDSSSSIEDVTNARKTLMSVQDQMID